MCRDRRVIQNAGIYNCLKHSELSVPGREIDARDLDHGLPGGILAGAIVKVGSQDLIYEMVDRLIGVILKCSIFQISIKSALVNHVS